MHVSQKATIWERLSPGITQASTGWKELEAQQRLVRSRTGGDVNGACTLYKHPASARLSHIGCQETTAEAANNKQATGSASGDNKEDITGLQIQQKAGFPKFGQDEYYNCK